MWDGFEKIYYIDYYKIYTKCSQNKIKYVWIAELLWFWLFASQRSEIIPYTCVQADYYSDSRVWDNDDALR